MAELSVTVPASAWFTSNRFPTNRGHHARMKAELRILATAAHRAAGRPRLEGPVHVCWSIGYPPRATDADPANAQPVTKPLLDQWVRDGLIVDDSRRHVVAEEFRWEPRAAPPGTHTVRATITDQAVPFAGEAS